MLNENELNNILVKVIGLEVTGISSNFLDNEILIYFKNETSLLFSGCALVYDLGIIGCKIKDVSTSAGLGMALELKKFNRAPEDYLFCSLSRDFKDFKNKNEIRLSFKNIKLN